MALRQTRRTLRSGSSQRTNRNYNTLLFGVFCFVLGLLLGISVPGGDEDDAASFIKTKSEASNPAFIKLLIDSGSDKYYNHHYEHYYTAWLEPYRNKPNVRMLEIGVDVGDSFDLWKQFFPHAELLLGLAYYDHPVIEYTDKKTGEKIQLEEVVDIDQVRSVHQDSELVEIIQGDQSKASTMDKVCARGPFDVILDDGSHVPTHVMFSLYSLFEPCLKPGGLYIIEDLETSFWDDGDSVYGYRLNGTGFGAKPENSVAEKLKQFVEILVKDKTDIPNGVLSIMPGDSNLCEVKFGKNIAALYKCNQHEHENPPVYKYFGQHFNRKNALKWVTWAQQSNPEGEFPARLKSATKKKTSSWY